MHLRVHHLTLAALALLVAASCGPNKLTRMNRESCLGGDLSSCAQGCGDGKFCQTACDQGNATACTYVAHGDPALLQKACAMPNGGTACRLLMDQNKAPRTQDALVHACRSGDSVSCWLAASNDEIAGNHAEAVDLSQHGCQLEGSSVSGASCILRDCLGAGPGDVGHRVADCATTDTRRHASADDLDGAGHPWALFTDGKLVDHLPPDVLGARGAPPVNRVPGGSSWYCGTINSTSYGDTDTTVTTHRGCYRDKAECEHAMAVCPETTVAWCAGKDLDIICEPDEYTCMHDDNDTPCFAAGPVPCASPPSTGNGSADLAAAAAGSPSPCR
jgi:hypothetical protein